MEAVYHLKPSELDADFIKTIKQLFKSDEVKITIETVSKHARKDEFMKAVEDVRLRKNIVSFSPDEL